MSSIKGEGVPKDDFTYKGPFKNYIVKNRDFLAVCLSILTTLLSESRQKLWFFDSLSVSFDDVVYEWPLGIQHFSG